MINSSNQDTAWELVKEFNCPASFKKFLGVIKRLGKEQVLEIASKIRQSKNVKSSEALFMYLTRKPWQKAGLDYPQEGIA